ncbi:MAG: hypothetical protein WDA25_02855 [Paracoccaceae bacterium]
MRRWGADDCVGGGMSETGLQKLAYVLLIALILYVSVGGAA